MKKILLTLAIAVAFRCYALGQNTIIAPSKIVDNNGAVLNTGQWCFGASCFTVTNGSIPSGSSVAPATAAIVVKNSSATFLTVPNVTIAGSYFSWDTYVVPSNAQVTGVGVPHIACTPGAQYTQTDGSQNQWVCESINGSATWNGLPAPQTSSTVQLRAVATGALGKPVSIPNSGTGSNAILNFTTPQGQTGARSVPGQVTATGPNVDFAVPGPSLSTTPISTVQAATRHYVDTSVVYNVAAFGATCDGTTDDTAGIQAALNAADSVGRGRATVVLPANKSCVLAAGEYLTIPQTTTLDLSRSDLTFLGDGGGACTRGTNGLIRIQHGLSNSGATIRNGNLTSTNAFAGCLINISDSTWSGGLHLNSLTIVGNTTTGTGIFTSNTGNLLFDHLIVQGFKQQINLSADTNVVDIEHSTFGGGMAPSAGTDSSNYMIQLRFTQSVNLHDNNFEQGPLGIYVGSYADKTTIKNNWMGDTSSAAPYTWVEVQPTFSGGGAVSVDDNWIYGTARASTGYGIRFEVGDANGSSAKGNHLLSGTNGIYSAANGIKLDSNSFLSITSPIVILANGDLILNTYTQSSGSANLISLQGGGNNYILGLSTNETIANPGVICTGAVNSTIVNASVVASSGCTSNGNVTIVGNVYSRLNVSGTASSASFTQTGDKGTGSLASTSLSGTCAGVGISIPNTTTRSRVKWSVQGPLGNFSVFPVVQSGLVTMEVCGTGTTNAVTFNVSIEN